MSTLIEWLLAIVLTLSVSVSFVGIVPAEERATAPMLEPVCPALVFAEFKNKVSYEEWLEILEIADIEGRFEPGVTDSYRKMLYELYNSVPSGEEHKWAEAYCSGKTVMYI